MIVSPTLTEVGPTPEETYSLLRQSVLNQPPSAKLAEKIAADPVDVLEMLDIAEANLKARKERQAKKAAKKAKMQLAGKKAANGLKQLALQQKTRKAAINKEVARINNLMAKAAELQKALPQKRARLELLQKKLNEANTKVASTLSNKTGAQKKAEKTVIDGKLGLLKKKLAKLEAAKSVLNKSIAGLQKVGKKGAAKAGAKDAKKDEKKEEAKKF